MDRQLSASQSRRKSSQLEFASPALKVEKSPLQRGMGFGGGDYVAIPFPQSFFEFCSLKCGFLRVVIKLYYSLLTKRNNLDV